MRLGPFATMAGTVVGQASGIGVTGASVTLFPTDSLNPPANSVSVYSRDNGVFRIERIAPGTYSLEASARGYKQYKSTVRFGASQARIGQVIRLAELTICPPVVVGHRSPGCP